jgi:hypothetical protein
MPHFIFSWTSSPKDDHELIYSPFLDHGGVTQVLIGLMRKYGELNKEKFILVHWCIGITTVLERINLMMDTHLPFSMKELKVC